LRQTEEIKAAPSVWDELKKGISERGLTGERSNRRTAPTGEPTAAQQVAGQAGRSLLGTTEQIAPESKDNAGTRAFKATVNVGNRFMAGLTTPEMLPLFVLGGVPGFGRAAAGAFGADLVAHIPQLAENIKRAEDTKPWSQERWEAALDTAMQGVMIKSLSEHAIRGAAPAPRSAWSRQATLERRGDGR
jgi:hypothetical protein